MDKDQVSVLLALPGVANSSLAKGLAAGVPTSGNPLKLLANLDTFQEATKKEIQNFSYVKKMQTGEAKEEEELDAETLLRGIPEDLLDIESLNAKHKAREKRLAE